MVAKLPYKGASDWPKSAAVSMDCPCSAAAQIIMAIEIIPPKPTAIKVSTRKASKDK